jgi:hypothetical protein
MQEGQGDFITNDYRVDIQYRGVQGLPPNAIQWGVIYDEAHEQAGRVAPRDTLLARGAPAAQGEKHFPRFATSWPFAMPRSGQPSALATSRFAGSRVR